MSIHYAILGLLSCQLCTGYDLKKIIQKSPFMHWSGNNNQIYKALVELLGNGYVTNKVQLQESSPSKKIYTITKEGVTALKTWVLTKPEPPEFKKTFLIQLAWADQLSNEELNQLLTQYESEIKSQLLLHEELKRRKFFAPARTPKETYLWEMIFQNILSSYESELTWIKKIRTELIPNFQEENKMTYQLIEKNNGKYIEITSTEKLFQTAQDTLDIISISFETDCSKFLLYAESLDEDFFRLRTGVAGEALQKFINYRIKLAMIVTNEDTMKGKFKELIAESNKRNDFRVFPTVDEAEKWLLN